jgi:hypothetical protein
MANFDNLPALSVVVRHRSRLGGPRSLAYVRAMWVEPRRAPIVPAPAKEHRERRAA